MNIFRSFFLPSLAIAAALSLGMSSAARAHDIWITSEGTGAAVRVVLTYGHPPDEISRPDRERLFALDLITSAGCVSILDKIDKSGHRPALVSAPLGSAGTGSVVAARYDNGFWASTGRHYYNTSRLNMPDAKQSLWSQKFSKVLLPGTASTVHTVAVGHRLELVPLVSPWASPAAPIRVKAIFDGKPLSGKTISVGDGVTDKDTDATTDATGVATVPITTGRWYVLSVSHRMPGRVPTLAENDAYVATMSFRP